MITINLDGISEQDVGIAVKGLCRKGGYEGPPGGMKEFARAEIGKYIVDVIAEEEFMTINDEQREQSDKNRDAIDLKSRTRRESLTVEVKRNGPNTP